MQDARSARLEPSSKRSGESQAEGAPVRRRSARQGCAGPTGKPGQVRGVRGEGGDAHLRLRACCHWGGRGSEWQFSQYGSSFGGGSCRAGEPSQSNGWGWTPGPLAGSWAPQQPCLFVGGRVGPQQVPSLQTTRPEGMGCAIPTPSPHRVRRGAVATALLPLGPLLALEVSPQGLMVGRPHRLVSW